MNLENEFDELARRKLEERNIPFREGDWLQAQELLARQQRKSVRIWPWMLGLLLVTGSTAWWLSNEQDATTATHTAANAPAAGAPSDVQAPSVQESENASTEPLSVPQQHSSTTTTGSPSNTGTTAVGTHTVSVQPSTDGTAPKPVRTDTKRTSTASSAATQPSSSARTSIDPPNDVGTIAQNVRTAPRTSNTASALPSNSDVNGNEGPSVPATTPPMNSPADPTAAADQDADQAGMISEPSISSDRSSGSDPSSNGTGGTVDTGTTITQPTITASQPSEPPVLPAMTPAPYGADSLLATAPSDSASTPNDSLAGNPPPPLPLQVPTVGSPWEISALAGLRTTNANYRGMDVQPGELRITGQYNPLFGLEAMHTGRNLSLGAGILYGTWSEQVDVAALDRTRTTIRPYWMLVPVDTTLLIITDTLFQGTDSISFVGNSVPSTVNVLQRTADTTTVSERLREARTVTVRTSYLEVAPLIDVHVTQARWTLGVRGGPTVGLLSGRRGELPGPGDDGTAPFREVAFREVMLGYQARAYVRYRWNAAWSIGLEPMIGGTLLNTFDESGLERRTAGHGVLMSLTYRLP
ncbi:MAG: hypothetical protein R2817_05145 [Flavobacteriales bacterium]